MNNKNFNYNKSINTNFNGAIPKGKVKMQTLDSYIEQALENLANRIQREMPQNGPFSKIVEKFNNPEGNTFAKDFQIRVTSGISKEYQDTRTLEIITEHPYTDRIRCGAIFTGTSDELKEFLKEPKIYSDWVKKIILEDSDKLF